mmetsp:Transcript_78133/g.131208  ORF Transcript_78133/g.131208 Transcript_78133/m.131208 type:complete len:149 (-) Transcript_78133:218-664(-)
MPFSRALAGSPVVCFITNGSRHLDSHCYAFVGFCRFAVPGTAAGSPHGSDTGLEPNPHINAIHNARGCVAAILPGPVGAQWRISGGQIRRRSGGYQHRNDPNYCTVPSLGRVGRLHPTLWCFCEMPHAHHKTTSQCNSLSSMGLRTPG